MKISVVATLYYSADYIETFHKRAVDAVKCLTDDYEIIFVNDGSPDNSLAIALKVAKQDKHVTVVDLSRNFGHHKAMMTGLSYAQGDRVLLIDSDLEEEPEWLEPFSKLMDETGCDAVYGVQKMRKGGWFERVSGGLFWKAFRLLARIRDFPDNPVTARLMSQRFVKAALQFQEREIFVHGVLHITGFDQRPMEVHKLSTSRTTYSLARKLALLSNSIAAFSNTPLIWIFQCGILILFLSLAVSGWIAWHWLLGAPPVGWVSVMMSVWLLGGLIISFIGVIGVYLSKIYSETKQRPFTIVRDVYRN